MFAPDPRLKTALELFHGGRFGDSIGCCEALWAEGVRSLPLHALLGELRLWQNRSSEAAQLLSAALAEQRDSVRLKAILAESYRRSDQLSEAGTGLVTSLGFAGLREFTPVMGTLRQPAQYILRSKDGDDKGRHGAVVGGHHHDAAPSDQPAAGRQELRKALHMLHHIQVERGIEWLAAGRPVRLS